MIVLYNAVAATQRHPRLVLNHQAQITKGASPPERRRGEPGLPGLVC